MDTCSSVPKPAPRTSLQPKQLHRPEVGMTTDITPAAQPEEGTTDFNRCRLCARHHALRVCQVFRAMQPTQRYLVASAHKFCTNCLALSHHSKDCPSAGICRLCGQRHHTLLHRKTELANNSLQYHAPVSRKGPSAHRPYRLRRTELSANKHKHPHMRQRPKQIHTTTQRIRITKANGKLSRQLLRDAIRKLRELENSIVAYRA
ncbi:PREDICTED: uncharacterized protein LOC108360571 [Rhagoletis zephyria]|uniref:uncharacterized protein LOC108360571 n=1 Tax=Rhagoletis zephyria TaxID=28612 RepID=UPI0008113CCE|nr:PREDICTED: uncharacterized protein LOC108360571 [Rhagoletis zephyria]XP_036346507.1 uncharacterized protein LOC118755799 [Rhagoletis pomonella]